MRWPRWRLSKDPGATPTRLRAVASESVAPLRMPYSAPHPETSMNQRCWQPHAAAGLASRGRPRGERGGRPGPHLLFSLRGSLRRLFVLSLMMSPHRPLSRRRESTTKLHNHDRHSPGPVAPVPHHPRAEAAPSSRARPAPPHVPDGVARAHAVGRERRELARSPSLKWNATVGAAAAAARLPPPRRWSHAAKSTPTSSWTPRRPARALPRSPPARRPPFDSSRGPSGGRCAPSLPRGCTNVLLLICAAAMRAIKVSARMLRCQKLYPGGVHDLALHRQSTACPPSHSRRVCGQNGFYESPATRKGHTRRSLPMNAYRARHHQHPRRPSPPAAGPPIQGAPRGASTKIVSPLFTPYVFSVPSSTSFLP